jgi:hypothetical protein
MAAAALAAVDEIHFVPRATDSGAKAAATAPGAFVDPNNEWLRRPHYFAKMDPKKIQWIFECKGDYVNPRAQYPGIDAYRLPVLGPLLKIWPLIYPYGHDKANYGKAGSEKMQQYAAEDPTKASYKATQFVEAWDEHLADEHGNDRHGMALVEWLRQVGESFREAVWANDDAREYVIRKYNAIAIDALKARIKKINADKAAKKPLSEEDAKLAKTREKDLEKLCPGPEEVKAAYFDAVVKNSVLQKVDDKGIDRYSIFTQGSVFRPMTAKMRAATLARGVVHPNKFVAEMFNKRDTKAADGVTIRAPFGYHFNDVPLVKMANGETVPFSKRKLVLTTGSIATEEWVIDPYVCNKDGLPGFNLVPITVYLFRPKRMGESDPTENLRGLTFVGAEDVPIPEETTAGDDDGPVLQNKDEPMATAAPAAAVAAAPEVGQKRKAAEESEARKRLSATEAAELEAAAAAVAADIEREAKEHEDKPMVQQEFQPDEETVVVSPAALVEEDAELPPAPAPPVAHKKKFKKAL